MEKIKNNKNNNNKKRNKKATLLINQPYQVLLAIKQINQL